MKTNTFSMARISLPSFQHGTRPPISCMGLGMKACTTSALTSEDSFTSLQAQAGILEEQEETQWDVL